MKPHILATNDDGIDSLFLREMVMELRKDFRVTVAAPMGEQSWIGRAVSRNCEVHCAEVDDYPCKAYALDGTPTDCVNIALSNLVKDDFPMAVCSGINIGFNTGVPILLSSGTLAGAIEGATWGLPAFAFSQHIPQDEFEQIRSKHGYTTGPLAESIKCSAAHARQFVKKYIDEKNTNFTVHNINFPIQTTMETESERTEPIRVKSLTLFKRKSPVSFHFEYTKHKIEYKDLPIDYYCLERHHISHTLIDLSTFGSLEN